MKVSSPGKWDLRFLQMAHVVADWSKDPSTKVGAVITRPDRTVASIGYNGFPRGVDDRDTRYHNRDLKYAMVVHGDLNAILNAREPLHGYTMYVVPMPPCSTCAGAIIQAGIKMVVCERSDNPRWKNNLDIARVMFEEAGVQLLEVDPWAPF